jgi:pilus assembly protein CpaB
MTRRIGLIALAVVLALVGTIAVYGYAHNADKRAVAAARSVQVVMVDKAVPAGTSWSDAVKGDYLSQERVPVNSAPSQAIGSLQAAVPDDQVATAQIAAGQIVVRQMFAKAQAATGILPIPEGKLAIAVSMSSSADVAGFVQPNSEVAIFITAKITKPDAGASPAPVAGALGGADLYVTKLLLPRVTVLATSQAAPADLNKASTASNNSANGDNLLITLALTQQQAQQVILAQQTGQLYLGLLSDTSKTAPDGGVTNVGVFKPTPIFVK